MGAVRTDVDNLIDGVREIIVMRLQVQGIDAALAIAAAEAVCTTLMQQYGGETHHVPKVDRVARRRAIIADLRAGKHPRDIAKKYDVGLSTVYRINDEMRGDREIDAGFGSKDWTL